MKGDLKVFLRYVFNFKGFIEGFISEIQKMFAPKRFSIILFFVAGYFLFTVSPPNNKVIAAVLLVLALIIHLRSVYHSGEHRDWYRKKIGIKSKKELLREEWSSKNEEDPKLNNGEVKKENG